LPGRAIRCSTITHTRTLQEHGFFSSFDRVSSTFGLGVGDGKFVRCSFEMDDKLSEFA
jgi:hypothetical protein